MKILLFLLWFGVAQVFGNEKFEFNYEVQIDKPATEFDKIRVWVPIAKSNFEQELISSEINSNALYDLSAEKKYGNAYAEINVEKNSTFPVKFSAKYVLIRKEAVTTPAENLKEDKRIQPTEFLSHDARVPINGVISTIAQAETKGLETKTEKLRKLYEYVVQNMTYSKEGQGWGEGDAVWACTHKRGNCTDFHSLLIGMARSQEIPARFEMGFPIAREGGEIKGYHCWTRAYDAASGWIPLDASEAKNTGKTWEYFGKLPANRIQLSVGRDLVLSKNQKGKPVNFFIYPYIEVDGKPFDLPHTRKIYSKPVVDKIAQN